MAGELDLDMISGGAFAAQLFGPESTRRYLGLTMVVLNSASPVPVATFHFSVLPDNWDEVERYFINIQPTLNGGFVDKYGPAPGQLTISGQFPRTFDAVYNLVMPVRMSGETAALWLRQFCDIASGADARQKAYRVILMNFVSNRHWQIEVKNCRIRQSTVKNCIWTYSLQIECLRPLPNKMRDAADSLLEQLTPSWLTGTVTSSLSTLLLGWKGLA